MNTLSFREAIARDLRDGPAWARSYQDAKRVIDQMVADGEVARVAPEGGRACNMIALTLEGAGQYFPGEAEVYWVLPRKKAVPLTSAADRSAHRAAQKDVVAQVVSEGGAASHAADLLGVSASYCQRLWREIVADMGAQAA